MSEDIKIDITDLNTEKDVIFAMVEMSKICLALSEGDVIKGIAYAKLNAKMMEKAFNVPEGRVHVDLEVRN